VSGFGPRNFLHPCLLLLLCERASHGYDLAERLKPFGVADGDAGTVYRALRSLEQRGLLRSGWMPSAAGPARRTYELTPAGDAALRAWLGVLEETRRTLDYYLERYTVLARRPRPARDQGLQLRPAPRGQMTGGQTARGQAARGQAARGQAARGQAARGQAARGQAARGQAEGSRR
jgi:PadR family transcriptional regulator, regulatory protein PadR